METYQDLIEAIEILTIARQQEHREHADSPAWVMLIHACQYLHKQANVALRGE